jgi:hypothetical protein
MERRWRASCPTFPSGSAQEQDLDEAEASALVREALSVEPLCAGEELNVRIYGSVLDSDWPGPVSVWGKEPAGYCDDEGTVHLVTPISIDTVLHEAAHLTTWIVSGDLSHGARFRLNRVRIARHFYGDETADALQAGFDQIRLPGDL